MFSSAVKDGPLITSNWDMLQDLIEGVYVREVRHVPRDHGVITEMFRPDWDPTGLPVAQIYQSRLYVGALGAWSCHAKSIDRLFVSQGHVKVVLFDGREDSPTSGRINELHVGDARPTFLVIPTGVWHGLQNLGASEALVLNFPTRSYDYEDPDHYRLPHDASEIPYSWSGPAGGARMRSSARHHAGATSS